VVLLKLVPDTLSLVYPPYDGLKKILISAVSHTPRVR
jgi:aldehyde dehydrogenase (NAD+)